MRKKIIQAAIIIIGISLIINLSRDILRLLKAGDQVQLAEQRVEELKVKQAELVEKKEYYQSPEFIESEARNKLNMAKPGETIVILPPNVEELAGQIKKEPQSEIPNWRQWWKLFF